VGTGKLPSRAGKANIEKETGCKMNDRQAANRIKLHGSAFMTSAGFKPLSSEA